MPKLLQSGWSAAVCGAAAICLAAASGLPAEAADAPIVCEWAYSNFAWGAQLTLRGIAADGRVLTFDSRTPVGGQPIDVDLLGLMLPEAPTADDLRHRYAAARPTATVLTAEDLARIAALAGAARDGTITREQRGADMGQSTLQCFVPAKDRPGFDVVLLISHGDWEERNTHPAAVELATLLTVLMNMPGIQP